MMSVQICVYLEPVLCKGILTHTVKLNTTFKICHNSCGFMTAKFAQYSSFITKNTDLLKESCSSFSVNYSFSHHTSVHFLLR